MPRSTSTKNPKTRKASETDTSGDLRLRMAFKRHLVQAKYSLAQASILMDFHKNDFTAEDTARLNHALLVVHELTKKHGDIYASKEKTS